MEKSRVKFKSNMKKVKKVFRNEIENRLSRVGYMLKDYLQERLQGDRTGKWYPLPEGARINPNDILKGATFYYQASAPGEYPAKRLGDLKETLSYYVNRSPNEISLIIGSPMDYAYDLEFEKERPFLSRSILENLEEIKGMIGKGLRIH